MGGISTASFTVLPVFGNQVTGLTSGATGYVHTIDGTELIVAWKSGRFAVGELVVNNRGTLASPLNEVSSTTVTNETLQTLSSAFVGQERDFGNWSVGLPYGSVDGLWSVGGRSTVTKTRAAGQVVSETIAEPVRSWVTSLSSAIIEGKDIVFEQESATDRKRLVVKDYKQSEKRGMVGALTASTTVNQFLATNVSDYNVDTLAKNSTGDYTITFQTPLARNDYRTMLTVSKGTTGVNDLEVQVYLSNAAYVRIRMYLRSTGALVDIPAGHAVFLSVFGGDI